MMRKKSNVFWLLNFLLFLVAHPILATEVEVDPRYASIPFTSIILIALFALFYYFRDGIRALLDDLLADTKALALILFFGIGLIIRLLFATRCLGYASDMSCWGGWAMGMCDYGPSKFYTSMNFADYPPGYMLVLWLLGKIIRALSLPFDTYAYNTLLKFPTICCDLIIGGIIYYYGQKKNLKSPLFCSALFVFNPAVIFDSCIWGQVDSVLCVFVICMFLAFKEKKLILASLAFVCGVLIKPQMFLFGPVFVIGYLYYCKESKLHEVIKQTIFSALVGIALFLAICLPFNYGSGGLKGIFELYTSTMGSYAYATVNALNFPFVLGGNWKPNTDQIFFVTYKTLGVLGILLSIGYALFIAYKDKKHDYLPLCGAIIIGGIFTFGHNMHERYLFPILACLLVTYLYKPTKRLLQYFSVFTLTALLNMCLVIYYTHVYATNTFALIVAIIQVISFVMLCWYSYELVTDKVDEKAEEPAPKKVDQGATSRTLSHIQASEAINQLGHIQTTDMIKQGKMTKKDWIICLALTLIYGVIAFTNLGSMTGATTIWEAKQGDSVTIDFGEVQDIKEERLYCSVTDSAAVLKIETSLDGTNWTEIANVLFDNNDPNVNSIQAFNKWVTRTDLTGQARFVRLTSTGEMLRIIEACFINTNDEIIPVTVTEATGSGANAFDEQDLVPLDPTYFNETHFDEIYHGRTGWENLQGISPYETTHPPLGKVLISLGIMLFGMVPFGWRFAGTLIGVLMIPAIYIFAKALFKRTRYAFIAAFLMCFDFMHFTQTRIATIDTYIVFFMILMYYFMYLFYESNYLMDDEKQLKKDFLYLAGSGICFGFGAASKWTGIYAGGGLAVIFFYSLYLRYKEYILLLHNPGQQSKVPNYAECVKSYQTKTLKILGWCCIFFVALPIVIYILSYLPQITALNYGIAEIWNCQKSMFDYHSKLEATHSFSSPWYKWPLMIRPVWYYVKRYADGTISTISSLGNPAIWWVGLAAIIGAFVKAVKSPQGSKIKFIAVSFLIQILPWVLVTRCTFLYHYFPCTPFIMLAIVWWIKHIEDTTTKVKQTNWAVAGYLALIVLLFIVFYPAISGLRVSETYIKALEWFSTWYFGV